MKAIWTIYPKEFFGVSGSICNKKSDLVGRFICRRTYQKNISFAVSSLNRGL